MNTELNTVQEGRKEEAQRMIKGEQTKEAAAVRIQARARGMATRKDEKQRKVEAEARRAEEERVKEAEEMRMKLQQEQILVCLNTAFWLSDVEQKKTNGIQAKEHEMNQIFDEHA